MPRELLCGHLFAFVVLLIASETKAADQLLFLHAIWRHGDRTPAYACKNDPHQENNTWAKYGGFEQLTPNGMKQHVELGEQIYDQYVTAVNFLSPGYVRDELYIRSTDKNRTLVSAMSNIIGMYHNRTAPVVNEEIPDAPRWPLNFLPIPIHTTPSDTDHIVHPSSICPRQNWIWDQIEKTPEYEKLVNDSRGYLDELSRICNESIDFSLSVDFWHYKDSFLIEQLYGYDPPVSQELLDGLVRANNRLEDLQNGLNVSDYNGINFKVELSKIRGGGLIWEMIGHYELKLHCLEGNNSAGSECAWMNKLKYYAYSGHDTTVGALMTIMGVKEILVPAGGYANYASALFFELWNASTGPCLKIKFRSNYSDTELQDITSIVEGCDSSPCCPLQLFRSHAKQFHPGNPDQLCLDTTSTSTSFDPDAPTPSAMVPTTPGSSISLTATYFPVVTGLLLSISNAF